MCKKKIRLSIIIKSEICVLDLTLLFQEKSFRADTYESAKLSILSVCRGIVFF